MSLRDRLRADVGAVLERDPSASSPAEVVLTSPGLWARWSHRLASRLHARGHRLLAGVIATLTRLVTGIELHPAASVGERVVIDHGQGTVIGETATVGDDALLYHGVTLGAKTVTSGERHPTIGDGVTLGANATVLGDRAVGDGATVGAGAVVVDDVEPGATVVGVPAERVDGDDERAGGGSAPDAGESARAASDGAASADGADRPDGPEAIDPLEEGSEPICEVGSGW